MKQRIISIAIPAILFISSLLFWIFCYPAHIAFNEQTQLFLLTGDYLLPFLEYPSGLVHYAGQFLTQFYFEIWVGALILSLFVVAIELLTSAIIKQWVKGKRILVELLSLLPALFAWAFMLDKHSLLAFPLALTVALIAVWGFKKIHKFLLPFAIAITIVLYYTIGATAFIFAIYAAIVTYLNNRNLIAISCIATASVLPLIAYQFVQFPLTRLYTSNCYYRVFDVLPDMRYSKADEDALLYSHLSRYKKWSAIIKRAEKQMPLDMASRQCVLMALAQKGLLLERMFDFPVLSHKDLISEQLGNMTEPSVISDIYFHIGLINQAELSAYNTQQIYYSHCVRSFVRLAECNIIKSDFKVARKYLDALEHTLFYKGWAKEMKKLLNNEMAIETHDFYGPIRRRLMRENFYFADSETDNILAHNLGVTSDNVINYDYLIAYMVLRNDLEKLEKLFEGNEKHLPKVVQEALLLSWMQKHPTFEGMPWNVDPNVQRNAVDFVNIFSTGGNMQNMHARFHNTYMYYNAFASHLLQ